MYALPETVFFINSNWSESCKEQALPTIVEADFYLPAKIENMFLQTRFPEGQFDQLKPDKILETLDKLQHRIEERFPGSGLNKVSLELEDVAKANIQLLLRLSRPIWEVRIFTFLTISLLIGLAVWMVAMAVRYIPAGESGLVELLQGVESAINEIILLSLAIFFLASLENRLKRRAALSSLHRLRSIAHIIDMHQLTKDPAYLLAGVPPTPSSPARQLSHKQLSRYLDYCTELLAITSKLAALHAQDFQDSEVLKTVNEVEMLAHALADKIWQKIMLLDKVQPVGRKV
ncbi:MAG: hypothetical protein D6816_06105 [Bacteroidetes bacterium]|nr:MAG: hypothetical protein D6816_06105 [Bacteroidota bacterium]